MSFSSNIYLSLIYFSSHTSLIPPPPANTFPSYFPPVSNPPSPHLRHVHLLTLLMLLFLFHLLQLKHTHHLFFLALLLSDNIPPSYFSSCYSCFSCSTSSFPLFPSTPAPVYLPFIIYSSLLPAVPPPPPLLLKQTPLSFHSALPLPANLFP